MIIIGITGTNGAGKGTVVDYLVNKLGFVHFSASGLIREEIIKKNLPINRQSMTEVANELRVTFGPSFVADVLGDRAEKLGKNCVIESLRTVGEIESLKKRGNFRLLAVTADRKLRFERILKRGSEKDNVSWEEFVKSEDGEMESDDPNKQNLKKCLELADVVVDNGGTVVELEKKIEKLDLARKK